MKNFLINSASIIAGKRFARLYKTSKVSPAKVSAAKVSKALDIYRALRRMLPTDRYGLHMGNHAWSDKRPFRATQGFKVRTFTSPYTTPYATRYTNR